MVGTPTLFIVRDLVIDRMGFLEQCILQEARSHLINDISEAAKEEALYRVDSKSKNLLGRMSFVLPPRLKL